MPDLTQTGLLQRSSTSCAGAMAAGAVNMALIGAEFDAADFDAATAAGEPGRR